MQPPPAAFADHVLTHALLARGWVLARFEETRKSLTLEAHRAESVLRVSVNQKLTTTLAQVTLEGAPMVVELDVRPELVGESLDKLFGVTVDTPVGEAAFDGRFVVNCAPAGAAPVLLPRATRAVLMQLPEVGDGPKLTLKGRTLSLSWSKDASAATLVSAVEAVIEVGEVAASLYEGSTALNELSPFRAGAGTDRAVDPSARETDRKVFRRTHLKFATLVTGTLAVAGAAMGLLGNIFHVVSL